MDHPEPSLASRKSELIRALARSRRAMEESADEVASALDLPGQFRASFASSSWQWLAASLAAGIVAGFVWNTVNRSSGRSPAAGAKAAGGMGPRIAKALLRGAFESFAKPALRSVLEGRGEKWLWQILGKTGS